MYEVADNLDLFEQYEQEQERLSRMRKRKAYEYEREERINEDEKTNY